MIEVDVRAELAEYFPDIYTAGDKYNGPSPFRYDRNPSFFVDLREHSQYYGCWHDSGAVDPEWKSGNLAKLLSFLRNETYEETVEYLTYMYGGSPEREEVPTLRRITLLKPTKVRTISEEILTNYQYRHPYLERRGISEPIQRLCGVGYDKERRAVVIPWRNADGTLGNVKYRKVEGKAFWYERNARPIREMIFGIDIVYRKKIRKIAMVEAEIDAMSFMTCGIPAVATGGTAFNRDKVEILIRSPVEEIVIVRDNDEAGKAWQRSIVAMLHGKVRLSIGNIPRMAKDVNEVLQVNSQKIAEIAQKAKSLKSLRTIGFSRSVR